MALEAPVGLSSRLPLPTGTVQLLSDVEEAEFEETVRKQLQLMGEDPDREGLLRTPKRVARSLAWLTRGYREDAWTAVGEGVFTEKHDHMVMVRDIELYSLCEHHLLPFFGKAHIAYIPSGRILGLSKLPRLVEVFARRLQVQERLTGQIAQAVCDVLHPRGVGVVIEAMHLCMMMRGVEKQNSKTITAHCSVRSGMMPRRETSSSASHTVGTRRSTLGGGSPGPALGLGQQKTDDVFGTAALAMN